MGQGPLCCCCRKRMGKQGLRGDQGWDGRCLWEVLVNLILLLPRVNDKTVWEGEFIVAMEPRNSVLHKPWAFPWQWRGCQPFHPLHRQCRQWMIGCFATARACCLENCPHPIPRDVMSHCGHNHCAADKAELNSSHAWTAWDLLRSAIVAKF